MRPRITGFAIAVLSLSLFTATDIASAGDSANATHAGPYALALKIRPVEPIVNGGDQSRSYRLAVFIDRNGEPITNADVTITYRKVGVSGAHQLPVQRMWLVGKRRKTIHFGNRVHLAPGDYTVKVTINDGPTAIFHPTVK